MVKKGHKLKKNMEEQSKALAVLLAIGNGVMALSERGR